MKLILLFVLFIICYFKSSKNFFAGDKIFGWGENSEMELQSHNTNIMTPTELEFSGSIRKVCSLFRQTWVLTEDCLIYSFGYFFTTGGGNSTSTPVLRYNSSTKFVVDMKCGQNNILVLLEDGDVLGYGANSVRELETFLPGGRRPSGLPIIPMQSIFNEMMLQKHVEYMGIIDCYSYPNSLLSHIFYGVKNQIVYTKFGNFLPENPYMFEFTHPDWGTEIEDFPKVKSVHESIMVDFFVFDDNSVYGVGVSPCLLLTCSPPNYNSTTTLIMKWIDFGPYLEDKDDEVMDIQCNNGWTVTQENHKQYCLALIGYKVYSWANNHNDLISVYGRNNANTYLHPFEVDLSDELSIIMIAIIDTAAFALTDSGDLMGWGKGGGERHTLLGVQEDYFAPFKILTGHNIDPVSYIFQSDMVFHLLIVTTSFTCEKKLDKTYFIDSVPTDPEVCGEAYCTSQDFCEDLDNSLGFKYTKEVVMVSVFVPLGCCVFVVLVALVIFVVFPMIRAFSKGIKTKNFDQIDVVLKEEEKKKSKKLAKFTVDKRLYEIKYSDLDVVGSVSKRGGSDSVVFKCDWKGKLVAFKCFKVEDIFTDQPSVDVFEKGCVLKKPRVGIVTEYCENEDVKIFLTKNPDFPLLDRIKLLEEISDGMEYLHDRKVVHRDLKADNVLLTKDNVAKIIDFGLSKVIERLTQTKTKAVGTTFYMAPEVTRGEDYDEKIDVFSYSVIVYEVLTNNFEPYGTGIVNVEYKVAGSHEFRPDVSKIEIDQEKYSWLIDVMKKSWSDNGKSRPTFSEIKDLFLKNRETLKKEE